MERMIYKFLDDYCGTGEFKALMINKGYHLVSSKNILVVRFWTDGEDGFTLFKANRLCKTVASFFSIDDDSATSHIKLWLGDRAGLKKVGDLKKFCHGNNVGN